MVGKEEQENGWIMMGSGGEHTRRAAGRPAQVERVGGRAEDWVESV